MKKFIAFSGGVESSTMCVLFGNKADAIFADTGFEHAELYKQIDRVEKFVREFHGNNFQVIRVRNERETLPESIARQKFYPSFKARYCTRQFKIEPIDNFLRQFESEGAELMIGLNAEEGNSRTGNHGLLQFVKYSYPLFDAGITRAKCIEILNAAGVKPDFPPYMKRGGCVGCYYKSKKEYAAMALLAPDEFEKVAFLEEAIQDHRGTHYGIRDGIPNMREFGEAVRAQGRLFDLDDIYTVVNDSTPCGVFCQR